MFTSVGLTVDKADVRAHFDEGIFNPSVFHGSTMWVWLTSGFLCCVISYFKINISNNIEATAPDDGKWECQWYVCVGPS